MALPHMRGTFLRGWPAFPGTTARLVAACAALAVAGCGGAQAPSSPSSLPPALPSVEEGSVPEIPADPPPFFGPPETFVGAGDIAVCSSNGPEQTARLLDSIPGTVFTAGDNAYPSGTMRAFKDCYEPTWGRHKARTRPSPGNHDYDVPGAGPYFEYFGASAGGGTGYYSYRLGGWLVLSLNSNVPAGEGSAQFEWVQSELATHRTKCNLAYWHHPVITSGPNGDNPNMQSMWKLMARAGVDLVISGHDHLYERFAPMNGDLAADPVSGVRFFIAGTGGARPYAVVSVRPLSEVRASVWGVLKLTLRGDSYDWEFISVPGSGFHDAGVGRCH